MRSYVAISIFALSASVLSAPTPQVGNLVSSVGNTAGAGNLLEGTGKDTEAVTDSNLLNDVDLSGLTAILKKEKREVGVGGLDKPVGQLVGDVTKTRVLRHARRLLEPVAGVADLATGSVNGVTDGLNVNVKRGLPVVQDLPLVGGVAANLDNAPVVGDVVNLVHGATGDLQPVTDTVYNAVEPVTELTNSVNVRSPQLVNAGEAVNGVTDIAGNAVDGAGKTVDGVTKPIIAIRSPQLVNVGTTLNDVTGTVGSAVGGVVSTAGNAVEGASGTVDGVKKPIVARSPQLLNVGATLNDVTGIAGNAVGDVTGTAGTTVEGASGTVDGVTKPIVARSPQLVNVGTTLNDVTGTVGSAVGGVGSTAGNAVEGATGTVDGVTKPIIAVRSPQLVNVGTTLNDVTGTVGSAVGGVGSTAGNAVEGASGTVDGVKKPIVARSPQLLNVGATLNDVTGIAGSAVGDVTGTAGTTVEGASGTVGDVKKPIVGDAISVSPRSELLEIEGPLFKLPDVNVSPSVNAA